MAGQAGHQPGSSARPDLPLAVVVGAGGMGMAVARRLGQRHRLLLADRDPAHLDAERARLRAEGHDVATIRCDVTSTADVAALAAEAALHGPIRVLAHVVGLSPSMGDFRTIMAVNLVGAARVCAAFAPLAGQGSCGILVSSSSAHMQPLPDDLLPLLDRPLDPGLVEALVARLGDDATPARAYVLSKAALIRLCRHEAPLWGERGARLLSLSPGLIATPMGAAEYASSPGKHALLAAVPLAREGTMPEIAGVVDFLASDAASFISGTDILVDGGMIAGLQRRARG